MLYNIVVLLFLLSMLPMLFFYPQYASGILVLYIIVKWAIQAVKGEGNIGRIFWGRE